MMGHRLLAFAILWLTGMAFASLAASQTNISVSANPGSLVVSTAVAGGAPFPVSETTTTYSVETVTAGQRITAALDAPLLAGMTLEIELAAPSGAASSGRVALSIVARTVVLDIPQGQFSGLAINYYFTATTAAGVVPRDVRGVILTITH
jgi:hypothetical protein